jgi:glycosyltransferase involved in cell wall biosynthesis
MHASLIITTYNWPEALDLTLAGAARQTTLPAEIIVADDGSGPATATVVADWQRRMEVPIQHVWQEDDGFRLARSRNRAIAAARHEYLVLVDGDMILHPRFVEDHLACARRDCFIQGSRPQLSRASTERMLRTRCSQFSALTPSLQRRAYAVRSPLLSRWASKIKATLAGIQGCNQSFWREHALRVNGYDERFTAWGPEDREFAARLLHIGLKRNYVRHRAIALHLYHATRAPQGANPFDALLLDTLRTRSTWCHSGLDAHLGASQ